MQSHGPAHPATLRFCTQGLAAREELLLKSMVRLLAHRTLQQWVYSPAEADLLVVDQALAQRDDPSLASAPAVLTLGAARREVAHFLTLPLRANELERELNQLGQHILDGRAPGHPLAAAALPDAPPPAWRLRRWPHPALVASGKQLRLATLLSGQPSSAAQLQQRSGLPLAECLAYVQELQRADLLDTSASLAAASTGAPAAGVPSAAAPKGLLARIRERLGLLSGSPAHRHE